LPHILITGRQDFSASTVRVHVLCCPSTCMIKDDEYSNSSTSTLQTVHWKQQHLRQVTCVFVVTLMLVLLLYEFL